jgi:hypothetical protein
LGLILGFRRSPLVVGRKISLRREVMPVADQELIETFYQEGTNIMKQKFLSAREIQPKYLLQNCSIFQETTLAFTAFVIIVGLTTQFVPKEMSWKGLLCCGFHLE